MSAAKKATLLAVRSDVVDLGPQRVRLSAHEPIPEGLPDWAVDSLVENQMVYDPDAVESDVSSEEYRNAAAVKEE